MQLIGADDDGNPIILYDSRWRDPSVMGYEPGDPQYRFLQELWMTITGRKISKATFGDVTLFL